MILTRPHTSLRSLKMARFGLRVQTQALFADPDMRFENEGKQSALTSGTFTLNYGQPDLGGCLREICRHKHMSDDIFDQPQTSESPSLKNRFAVMNLLPPNI